MHAPVGSHLTEDALDSILLSLSAPHAVAHAEACPECARRLQSAHASLLGTVAPFNHATLAWSEARSNTLTRDLSTHQSRPVLTLHALASYAAAALVAATVMLTAGLHHRALSPDSAQPSTSTVADEQIDDDNAMLHAIDSELYRPVAIPAAITEDPEAHLQRHAEQARD